MLVLKPREKVMAGITGLVLFSLGWAYFVVQPVREQQAYLDSQLKAKNLELYEEKKILSGSSAKSAGQDLLKPFLAETSVQEEMSRMIKEIERSATSEGLQVVETKPQPVAQNAGWFELKVNISFEGRFSDVVKFLYQLEQSPKPLLVNEMILEANLPQQMTIHGQLEVRRLLIAKSVSF